MPQSSLDSTLGRLVVEKGLATAEEVQQCLEQQRNANQMSLAELLVRQGVVTRKQIARLRPEVEEQRVGDKIPGYRIIQKLGSGAMATVYKAKQLSLDRPVAIKILPHKHTNNPQFVERFYAEGKAAAKLNHPNIVQAIDVAKAGDTHYFVMEYVEGHTVFDHITQHGRYSEKEALNIAIQIARALEHAHNAGFIHRDVKPKNIMITPDGAAKLADMGLARAVSDREAAEAEQGKAYGTPYYISPEQIRGQLDVDFRADIYSFGATLYHMVTGQVPFEGPTPSAVMHKHLKAELVPPDHLVPELSSGISEIIEVCMAKDRQQRYGSTADLLEDLEAVARGEPPLQARRVFDLSALSALAQSNDPGQETQLVALPQSESLTAQPLFWIALAGWVLVLCLLVILAVTAST
ncbi:MAG TPA: serine/threonine-protein kinase [Phycisphaeraceae bacterium]